MKKRILLIPFFLTLLTITFVLSCQRDDFNDDSSNSVEDPFKVTQKRMQELKTDPLFSPIYSKIVEDNNPVIGNPLFRTIIPTEHGHIIISDSIVKISEFLGIISYTFPIENTSSDPLSFQNLIVNKFPGQDFRYYIATYTPDGEPEESHSGEYSFEGEKVIEEIDIEEGYLPISYQQRSDYEPCTLTVLKWCNNGTHGGYGETHPAGERCVNPNRIWYELVKSGDCASHSSYISQVEALVESVGGNVGGGGGNPQNPNNPNPGNSTPDNSGNPGTPGFGDGDGFVITNPTRPANPLITAHTEFFEALNVNLDYKYWWNSTENWFASDFIMAVFNVNNNFTDTQKSDFALSLVGFCVGDNIYGTSATINIISQILQSDYSPVNLTQQQKNWLNNSQNTDIATEIYGYLAINGLYPIYNSSTPRNFNQQSWEFASWASNFFNNNPNTTWEQFENWFMGVVDFFENNLNINPDNISYETPLTQQPLPSFNNFVNNFPKLVNNGIYSEMSAPQVYSLVGGSLLNSYNSNPTSYSNACSIRGSRALLYSGITIPVLNYPNVGQRTQKGSDNLNYILDAVSFNKFMIDKFGDTPHKLEETNANDSQQVANLLNGKNGIYVIINSSHGQAGYSGHVDVIINGICIGGAYTLPQGGVKSIRIWVLD